MSTNTNTNATTSATELTGRWLPAAGFGALGRPGTGPEIDYGMRWGEHRDIRVSLAPDPGGAGGILYAHDPRTDRYLLLAAQVTRTQVDAAWRELTACTTSPDAYLAFAALDQPEPPLTVERATGLLLHCAEQEMRAYRTYSASAIDAPDRVDAAFAVVVARSARVSAETVLTDAARAADPDSEPVIVRYRVHGERDWSGRVAAPDLAAAAATTGQVADLAGRHHLTLQATSVSQGHVTLAAARVPELSDVTHRPGMTPGAPRLAL